MGRLIPAGTGFPMYKDIRPVKLGEEISVEDLLGGDPLAVEEKWCALPVPGSSTLGLLYVMCTYWIQINACFSTSVLYLGDVMQ